MVVTQELPEEEIVVGEGVSMIAVQPTAAMNSESTPPIAYARPLNTTSTTPLPHVNTNANIIMNGEPPTAYATPVTGGGPSRSTTLPPVVPMIPMDNQEKLGSKCCGCCCDFR